MDPNPMGAPRVDISTNGEIDLSQLLSSFWAGRWVVLSVTSVAIVAAIILALNSPSFYTAHALLAPSDQTDSASTSLMQQYAGLASLAGVNIQSGQTGSKTQLGIELMSSRSFIGGFVARRGLAADLVAVDSWDKSTDSLVYDIDVYDPSSDQWVDSADEKDSRGPSLLRIYDAFLENLKVTSDPKTGFVRVAIKHKSPEVAANWVNWLVEDVNDTLRSQAVSESRRSIVFLEEQVAKTAVADLQKVFFGLIQSQTERMMLAEVREEFVFKVIDPAVPPEVRSEPNRRLIVAGGAAGGFMLSLTILMIGGLMRRST